MTDKAFDLIDETLRSSGPDAGFDLLAKKVLEDKNYPLLFEVRLLKKRYELGLPLIQVDDSAAMPPETRREYDKAFIDAAREVGGLFLADANIPRAWPYFRAIGETAPISAAIEKFNSTENTEPIIEIAFLERVNPYKGFQMILSNFGICRAITSFGQFPSREGRDESLRLLVRTLHGELVESLKRVIARNEGEAPDTQSIPELIAGRDWLFEGNSYYADTSHVSSVIRFSVDLTDAETLGLASEIAEYGTHLGEMFHERSDPPFDKLYADHAIYLRAMRGEDVDGAVAHFRGKIEACDPDETGSAPFQVIVTLLAKLKRYEEAIDISQRYLSEVPASELGCPSLVQLCFLAGDAERLRKAARDRGDILNYTAAALGQCLIFLLLALPMLAGAADFPEARISSGVVEAKLYPPDSGRGYYRGTRFDWSGVIHSLRYKDHEYFGQWFERYDPKLHDAIMGPVEEFLTRDAGLGYAEAKAGGTFVRIGVGVVKKPEEDAYQRFKTYEIVDPGKRALRQGKDWIEFTHEQSSDTGYGYVYTKTIRLAPDKPVMTLEHSLRNTGTKVIETEVYDHNFFVIDGQPTGPESVVRLPFNARATQDLKGLADVRSKELVYSRELEKGQSVFTELEGFGPTARDYDIHLENRNAGAGVRITGDKPIAKLVFWSIRTTFCPEPYIDMSIDPGKESTWKITYEFYTLPGR